MKLIKVITLILFIQLNTFCSTNKSNVKTSSTTINNKTKKIKKQKVRKNNYDDDERTTDDLRDEQMQDYENELKEMYN